VSALNSRVTGDFAEIGGFTATEHRPWAVLGVTAATTGTLKKKPGQVALVRIRLEIAVHHFRFRRFRLQNNPAPAMIIKPTVFGSGTNAPTPVRLNW